MFWRMGQKMTGLDFADTDVTDGVEVTRCENCSGDKFLEVSTACFRFC